MSTGAMSPPAGDPNMEVTNPRSGVQMPLTSDATVLRRATALTVDTIGPCHRQALWCGMHHDVWPHGQAEGCNTYVTWVDTWVQRLEAL